MRLPLEASTSLGRLTFVLFVPFVVNDSFTSLTLVVLPAMYRYWVKILDRLAVHACVPERAVRLVRRAS